MLVGLLPLLPLFITVVAGYCLSWEMVLLLVPLGPTRRTNKCPETKISA